MLGVILTGLLSGLDLPAGPGLLALASPVFFSEVASLPDVTFALAM
jgi:hypothetical protein